MDICDVFLEMARALRYTASAHKAIEFLVFLPLPVSWLVFRLVYFARVVLFESLIYCVMKVGWQNVHCYYGFNILLFSLFAMNVSYLRL